MTAPKFKDEWHDVIDHQDAKIQRQSRALTRIRALVSDAKVAGLSPVAWDALLGEILQEVKEGLGQ